MTLVIVGALPCSTSILRGAICMALIFLQFTILGTGQHSIRVHTAFLGAEWTRILRPFHVQFQPPILWNGIFPLGFHIKNDNDSHGTE